MKLMWDKAIQHLWFRVFVALVFALVTSYLTMRFTAYLIAANQWDVNWHTLITPGPEHDAYMLDMSRHGINPWFAVPPRPTFLSVEPRMRDYIVAIPALVMLFVTMLAYLSMPRRRSGTSPQ